MSRSGSRELIVTTSRYVVPTGRAKVPAGRYVVPTGKDNVIVSAGRSKVIPAGRTILVLEVIILISLASLRRWLGDVAMKMEYWIMNSDHNLWNIVLNGNSRKKTGRDPKGNIMILPPVSGEEHIAPKRDKTKPDNEIAIHEVSKALPLLGHRWPSLLRLSGGLDYLCFDDLDHNSRIILSDLIRLGKLDLGGIRHQMANAIFLLEFTDLKRKLEETDDMLQVCFCAVSNAAAEFALIGLSSQVKLEESKERFDKWKESSKNLDKLINSSMSFRSKFGLGFGETFRSDEVFDPSAPSILKPHPEDVEGIPLYDSIVLMVGQFSAGREIILLDYDQDQQAIIATFLKAWRNNQLYLMSGSYGTAVKDLSRLFLWKYSKAKYAVGFPRKNGGSHQSTWFNSYRSTGRILEVIDSGCSRSMTGNKEKLDDFVKIIGGIVTFGGGDGKIIGKGTIRTSNDFEKSKLQNYSLWNSKLLEITSAWFLEFKKQHLYSFNLMKSNLKRYQLWQEWISQWLPSKIINNDHNCVACNKGKQHKASYKAITAVSTISEPLQLLHMDLFGPTSIRSIDHKYYSLVVTDDLSRFSWVFFLGTKDETYYILKDFITFIENQLNKKVKAIRCDNGTEFKNSKLIELCGSKGIKRDYSNARTPQQNRVAERKNRTLIEAARTMLADSKLPTMFWTEAVSTACYVLNRVLVTRPHNKTPYELLSGKVPNISHLKPFGCHVTILNTSDHLGKFEGKADEGFIVGYAAHSKAYRVYNLSSKKIEEILNLRYLEDKPNIQGLVQCGKQDDSGIGVHDEQVIVVPSFPSNRFSGPKVHEASEMVESNSDYAEELARLQRQEHEAKDTAKKYGFGFSKDTKELLRQADMVPAGSIDPAASISAGRIDPVTSISAGSAEPFPTIIEPVHADETSLPPGHS
ncbi:putative ribonuclease H-like domain-containing protein [Tanacetum coccineum]|uniref:Ribonuclease H-like domain-containing protein n=1 Tax=Tanacetum coccineum TaxID=301880 RepID=A0ABQ5DEW7_9ASTR